jgi:hypothetical protein
MNLLMDYFGLKKIQLFIIILSGNLLIIWLSKLILINETVFYNTYSEQITYDRAMILFTGMKKLSWVGYAFTPILLIIKIFLISTVIYIGGFLCDLHEQLSFGTILKIVIASEIVFVVAGLTKLVWFSFFGGNYTLNDLSFFYPLSLIDFFNRSEVSLIWVYPLQTMNLFQIFYILLLTYGLNKKGGLNWSKSEKVVMISYLPGLLIAIVLVMFITVDSGL